MHAAPQVYVAQDLPPGWVVAAADEFGTPYFCNLWTGETQWERPSLATRSTFDYRAPADLADPGRQWAAAPVNVPARRQRSDRAKAAFSLFVKSMSGRRPGRDFRFQR